MHCNTEVSSSNTARICRVFKQKAGKKQHVSQRFPKICSVKIQLKWCPQVKSPVLESETPFIPYHHCQSWSLFLGTLSHKCSATEKVPIFPGFLLFWRGDKELEQKLADLLKWGSELLMIFLFIWQLRSSLISVENEENSLQLSALSLEDRPFPAIVKNPILQTSCFHFRIKR